MLNNPLRVRHVVTCGVCDEVVTDRMVTKDNRWLVERAQASQRVEYCCDPDETEHYVWRETHGICFNCSQDKMKIV